MRPRRMFAPRMLGNRASPRRRACSTAIGSPRYRRIAYSGIAPVTMLVRVADTTDVAIASIRMRPKFTVGNEVGGGAAHPPPTKTGPKMGDERAAERTPGAAARGRYTT